MKFWGRTEQRKKLHRMIDKSGQTVSLVYGRRRVGKSELIKQVLRESDLPGIYCLYSGVKTLAFRRNL